MRRTLMLDEDDLIMVVKEDIVKQIDESRGELNRTEFVNVLIQAQLKESLKQNDCVKTEDFQHFSKEIMGLLHNFLQFFVSYGMAMGRQYPTDDIQSLNQQLESIEKLDELNDEGPELNL